MSSCSQMTTSKFLHEYRKSRHVSNKYVWDPAYREIEKIMGIEGVGVAKIINKMCSHKKIKKFC